MSFRVSMPVVASLFIVPSVLAEPPVRDGRVIAVTDGRTLVALVGEERLEVRIAQIEAPRGGQRHAIVSRQSLVALCGGEPVRIEMLGRKDNATVARVLCNGTDPAAEQLRRGMATLAVPGEADVTLAGLQAEAKAARRGVWSESSAAQPSRQRTP